MFGSKRRAKAKAEKLKAVLDKKCAADVAKHLEKRKEDEYWYGSGKAFADKAAVQVTPVKMPEAKQYASASWDINKDAPKKVEKDWYNTIEGSLNTDDKFAIQFDGEATLENLQMIQSVLGLHISKLQLDKNREQTEKYNSKVEAQQRSKEELALIDKRLKEQREHELKVIAANKDAGVPLVQNGPNTPPGTVAGVSIPNIHTHQLNGQAGASQAMQESVDYYKYANQMQSGIATNGTKQYGY